MKYTFDSSIIRAYDIRGIYNETLRDADAYHIGMAFAAYMNKFTKGTKVAVGRDGRLSSPALHGQLIKGLSDGGLNVVDFGVVPTPALYYGAYQDGIDAGIMITGSHNPPNYNGFKMVVNKKPFYGSELKMLESILDGTFIPSHKGEILAQDIKPAYIECLAAIASGNKSLKVVWDPGNGAVGSMLRDLVTKLPGEHIIINEAVDGTFPSHHPDPTILKNLQQLIDEVKSQKADLGIAFDGDGDRLAAIDSTGAVISGERLLTMFAIDLAKRFDDQLIICDVKTSDSILKILKDIGFRPMLWKTGHSNIKVKMKELGCQLAGEMSGHIFFGENYYGFDDAVLGAVKLFNLLLNSTQTLEELNSIFPITYTTPEIKVKVLEEEKFQLIDDIRSKLTSASQDYNDLDGVRVSNKDGWWLVRASNTENCLTVRVESSSEQNFVVLKGQVANLLTEVGVVGNWL